jgi:hypothetical protein
MSNDPIVAAALEQFKAAMRESHSQGYMSGQIDARKHILDEFRKLIDRLAAETVDATLGETLVRVTAHIDGKPIGDRGMGSLGRPPRSGSDQDHVLQVIRTEPGLRGVDVALRLAGSVQERTVRTSLHRLKKRTLIESHDGKWWPVARTFPQQKELEEIEGQSAPTD